MKWKTMVLAATIIGALVLIGLNIWVIGLEGAKLNELLAQTVLIAIGGLVFLWGVKK